MTASTNTAPQMESRTRVAVASASRNSGHRFLIDQSGRHEMADHRRDDPFHEALREDQQRNRDQKTRVDPEVPEKGSPPLTAERLPGDQGADDNRQPGESYERDGAPRQAGPPSGNQPDRFADVFEKVLPAREKSKTLTKCRWNRDQESSSLTLSLP